jgi:hypothetical protein
MFSLMAMLYCPYTTEKQVRDMDEKTLVQTIYKKYTYNKHLNLAIKKLLHLFLSILPLYMCFHIPLY